MNGNIMLLFPVLFPLVAGILIKLLNLENRQTRQYFVGAVVLINAAVLLFALRGGDTLEVLRISSALNLAFRVDNISRLFTVLASVLWIFATFYAFEYMKHEKDEVRFFTFLTITLGAMIGIGFSGNLFTFYLFYEMMTLASYPLVVHSMTEASRAAGVKYLIYSLLGAALTLVAVMVVSVYGTSLDFVAGGTLLPSMIVGHESMLLWVYFLAVLGYGAKAGMYPLHAWLPEAHPVAPAPASALLSGIITKAGVLGVIRMTYFVFGADFIRGTWAHTSLLVLALLTVFLGSMLAYKAKQMKVRLAYSSVSQVSYVFFGILLLNVNGFAGGMLHMVFHALIKNVLFLSVGAIMYKTNKTHVSELRGIGKSMPVVMWCFTLASLALVGIPPASGFVSKYYLAMGGLEFGNQVLGYAGVIILIVSALLTAGYLLAMTITAFFPGPDFEYDKVENLDPNNFMKIPLILLTTATIAFGIFPTQLIDFILTMTKGIL